MKGRYLEVTFRRGRPLAAYLYLPREAGVHSARTETKEAGILIDYDASGKAIGIEITAPATVTARAVDSVLAELGLEALAQGELSPLRAA